MIPQTATWVLYNAVLLWSLQDGVAVRVCLGYSPATALRGTSCWHSSGVLTHFCWRAIMGHRQFKERYLRAKWTPLLYVLLCILKLTKGHTRFVRGPDLAHGPPFEKAWHSCSVLSQLLPTASYETYLAGQGIWICTCRWLNINIYSDVWRSLKTPTPT